MNDIDTRANGRVFEYQVHELQDLVTELFNCCQERVQYQSEKFDLPDAELRCLMLFGNERYLTPKYIAQRMNVAKSRVSRIIKQLIARGLIQQTKDPEDSRVSLLSLTQIGQKKWQEINSFLEGMSAELLNQMDQNDRRHLLNYLGMLQRAMKSIREGLF